MNQIHKIEDFPKLPYELEKIDWKKWLLFERCMNYQILSSGFDINSNRLSVRNLRYNNKIIAFQYHTEFNGIILHLPVLIEENEIISCYMFAIEPIKYKELICKLYSLNIQNMGCGCKDEARKAIIDFINDVFENRRIARYDNFSNFYDKFNPWVMNNNKLYNKKVMEAVKDLHNNDLVKITNRTTGEVYFGIVSIDKNNEYELGEYRCFIIETDYKYGNYCARYFLPTKIGGGHPSDWIFSKASVDELSKKQLEYYNNNKT